MTLLSGWALGLFGLGAVVIAVYFLKRQARKVPVSSLALWEGLERRPRSALRWRWTQLLGLLLQLLALSALVLGVAEPVWEGPASGVRTLALVLDGSASMRARISPAPQGPRRYERAVRKAQEALRANAGAETALFEAAAPPRMLVSPTRDPGEIERALRSWRPGYAGNAPLADLRSLVEGAFPSPPERVVFVTDRPLAPEALPPGWELLPAAEGPAANVGITRFVVRPQPQPEAQGFALLLSVWNGSPRPRSLRVQVLTGEDELLAEHLLEIPPRSEETLTAAYAIPPPERLIARLLLPEGAEDAWPEDDIRYAAPPMQRPWRVRWEGEPSFYLERFLALSGLAEILPPSDSGSGARPDAEEEIPSPDGTLYHGVPAAEPRAGRFLLVRSGMPPWVELGEPVEALGLPVRATQDHPLLAGLDPTSWRLVRVPRASLDPAGTVLLRAGEVPILYLYEAPGVRIAYLGVDLGASNVGLSLDFPILLYRLLRWLAPPLGRERDAQLLVGEELPLTAPDVEALEIVRPDGRRCRPRPELEGDACAVVDRPGFYALRYRESGRVQTFAANPPSEESYEISSASTRSAPARASATTPAPDPAPGPGVRVGVGASQRPLWPWLLLGGLWLLGIEWLYAEGLLGVRALKRRGVPVRTLQRGRGRGRA